MDSSSSEAVPAKALIEALDTLQAEFRAALQGYAARIDEDIQRVQKAVLAEAARKKPAPGRIRDLRDMLTLLNKSSIKPDKARRKELKKIDALLSDLTMLIENW